RQGMRQGRCCGRSKRGSGTGIAAPANRATQPGAFLELAEHLRNLDTAGVGRGHLADHWRRNGLRACDADKENTALGNQREEPPETKVQG
ncbi:MAG: hypothetical protein ACREFS_08925, partial [Acetobacteraceae bacterium]